MTTGEETYKSTLDGHYHQPYGAHAQSKDSLSIIDQFKDLFLNKPLTSVDFIIAHLPIGMMIGLTLLLFAFSPEVLIGYHVLLRDQVLDALPILLFTYLLLLGSGLSLSELELQKRAHVNYYRYYRYFLAFLLIMTGMLLVLSVTQETWIYHVPPIGMITLYLHSFDRSFIIFTFIYFDQAQVITFLMFMISISLIHGEKIYRHLKNLENNTSLNQADASTAPSRSETFLTKLVLTDVRVKNMSITLRTLTWVIFLEQTLLMPFILKSLLIDFHIFSTEWSFIFAVLSETILWIITWILLLKGLNFLKLPFFQEMNDRQIQYLSISLMIIALLGMFLALIGYYPVTGSPYTEYMTLTPQISLRNAIPYIIFKALLPKTFALPLLITGFHVILQKKHASPNNHHHHVIKESTDEANTPSLDVNRISLLSEMLDKRPNRLWIASSHLLLVLYLSTKIILWSSGKDVFSTLMLDFNPDYITLLPLVFFLLPEALFVAAAIVNVILGRRGYPSFYFIQAILFLVLAATIYHRSVDAPPFNTYFSAIRHEFYTASRINLYLGPESNLWMILLLTCAATSFMSGIQLSRYQEHLKNKLRILDDTSPVDAKLISYISDELSKTIGNTSPAFVFLLIIAMTWPLQLHSIFFLLGLTILMGILLPPLLSSSPLIETFGESYGTSNVLAFLFTGPILWIALYLFLSVKKDLTRITKQEQPLEFKEQVINHKILGALGTTMMAALLTIVFRFGEFSIIAFLSMILLVAWCVMESARARILHGLQPPRYLQDNAFLSRLFKWYVPNKKRWLIQQSKGVGLTDLVSLLKAQHDLSADVENAVKLFKIQWEEKNGITWILVIPGYAVMLTFLFLLLVTALRTEYEFNVLFGAMEVFGNVFFAVLLLLLLLLMMHFVLRAFELRERLETEYYLIHIVIGSLLLILFFITIEDVINVISLGIVIFGYFLVSNFVMYQNQSTIKEEFKLKSPDERFSTPREMSSHYHHYQERIVLMFNILILYHLPLFLMLVMMGVLTYDPSDFLDNASLLASYYHGTSEPLLHPITFFIDHWIMYFSILILRKDLRTDEADIKRAASILKLILLGKIGIVSLGFFLMFPSSNTYWFFTTLFLISILGSVAYISHLLSKSRMRPVADYKTKTVARAPISPISQKTLPPPPVSTRTVERKPQAPATTVPTRSSVTKESLLIKEYAIPDPTPGEIQWAEIQAQEYLLKTLKEKGFIEIEKLPKYVGRVKVDFKHLISRLQMRPDLTIVWSSDGKIIYDDEYLENELLKHLSRNRAMTISELAQKFNLESETVSHKIKRWFVDGRLN